MRIGSLFSGYGGLDLAVQQVLGGEVAWHVEYDKAPSRILDHHFPGVPNYGDVTKLDFTSIEPVDVLTGGYPCQPFSHAGLRKGTDDDRHLWPHVLRAIREMAPRLAVLENVRGHLSLGFDVVLADLASVGWSARWGVVRASDAGACHQRARLFIVAYPDDAADDWQRPRQEPRFRGQEFANPLTDAGSPAVGQHTGEPLGSQAGTQEGDGPQHRRGVRTPTDASRQRHGTGQDTRGLGRLDRQDAGSPRQRQRPRQVFGDRGAAATADAVSSGRPRWSPQPERGPERRVATTGPGQNVLADAQGNKQRESSEPGSLRHEPWDGTGSHWGDYGPAIARWERAIGRRAPAPTEPGRTGAPRLSPAFVEWMMGLPEGWVTDPAIGISRNDQLKALGNGVVPQQAALALRTLLAPTASRVPA